MSQPPSDLTAAPELEAPVREIEAMGREAGFAEVRRGPASGAVTPLILR